MCVQFRLPSDLCREPTPLVRGILHCCVKGLVLRHDHSRAGTRYLCSLRPDAVHTQQARYGASKTDNAIVEVGVPKERAGYSQVT